jgi:hypothetical protein
VDGTEQERTDWSDETMPQEQTSVVRRLVLENKYPVPRQVRFLMLRPLSWLSTWMCRQIIRRIK